MGITVNGPNGLTINFPDGTDPATINKVMSEAVGKAPAPEAKHEQSYAAGLARTALGQGAAFGLGDEIAAGARSLIGGESYDTALADERAKVKQFEDENPVAATVGEIGGSLLTPGVGLAMGAIKPAARIGGKIAQGIATGGVLGGIYGFNSSEGGDGNLAEQVGNRVIGGAEGAVAGGVAGAVLPIAGAAAKGVVQKAREVVSPQIVRMTGGVENAADEVLANRFRRAGINPGDVASDLQKGQDATKFANSQATLPEMIVDTSPAMQKLGGSVFRAGNEANQIAGNTLASRQGGDPAQGLFGKAKSTDDPTNQYERLIDTFKRGYGVKAKDYAKQAKTIKNEQSVIGDQSYTKAFASQDKFDEPLSNTLVAWHLKVRDEPGADEQQALQKALNLFRRPDTSLKSQGLNNRVDDMTEHLQSLVDKANEASIAGKTDVADGLMKDAARVERNRDLVVKRLQESYTDIGNQPYPIDTLKRFDLAKRTLDGMIGSEKNGNVKRLLVQFKNDTLDAVHGGDRSNPTMNKLYSDARSEWGSKAELLDALEAGKKYLADDGGQVTAQDYRGMTKAEQSMFRLGVTRSLESKLGGKAIGPTVDFTQVLRKPNIYQKLRDITPQGKTSENLNELVNRETRMSRTAGRVMGNSATAERVQDDLEFGGRDLVSSAVEKLRSKPGVLNFGLDIAKAVSENVFGFKDDMALALAKRLFAADPQEQQVILARIQQRMGSQKMHEFVSALSKAANAGRAATTAQVGTAFAQHPESTLSGGIGPRYDGNGNLLAQ